MVKGLLVKRGLSISDIIFESLPLFLTGGPQYDLNRLARKIARLRCNPSLDGMTRQYDRLHRMIIGILHRHGIDGLIGVSGDISDDFVVFLLKSRGANGA